MRRSVAGIFLLFISFGCVDRLYYDVPAISSFGISISGHVSDQPGPYRVSIFRTFDIDSKDNIKTGVTANSVVISDNEGHSETLSQVQSGVYETKSDGMRGKVGGVYKVRVELADGRTYESDPDTLPKGGAIDSVYHKMVGRPTVSGYVYEFHVYANSSVEPGQDETYFSWTNKTTYKAETKPLEEMGEPPYLRSPCYRRPDNVCNFVAPCSGYDNLGSTRFPDLQYTGPCTCCICWYDQYSQGVLLSDGFITTGGKYRDVLVDRVELTGWLMMFKARFEVSMQSLSPRAYKFWKAVRDQRSATNSLFQPLSGKIAGNINQVGGVDTPVFGVFYATAVTAKAFYISRGDFDISIIPTVDFPGAGAFPCYKLAPYSVTTAPSFWID